MKNKPAIIILNMHYTGLGIARNLASTGAEIYGLSSLSGFPGNYTRYARFIKSPDSLNEKQKLLEFLSGFSKKFAIKPLLFPTRDHDIAFMMEFREELEILYTYPFAANNVMDAALNKDKLEAISEKLQIPFPRNFTIFSTDNLFKIKEKLKFPCIAKPVYASQWRKPGIWQAVGSQKVVKLNAYSDLETFYAKVSPFENSLIVQEWIEGGDENLVIFGSYCNRESKVEAFFTGRKRVQFPPQSGTGIIVENFSVKNIVGPSKALLKEIGFFGISEIEFKMDDRTGKYYLIEINPRHWDQHRLGAAVGVNLSRILYSDLIGENFDRQIISSQKTVRWIAERDFFLELARGFFLNGNYSPKFLLTFLFGKKIYPIFDWRDPLPGIFLLKEICTDSFKLIFARFRAPSKN